MAEPNTPKSKLSHYTTDTIYYRNENLVDGLIGQASFIDVFMRQSFGRICSDNELKMIDAVLVSLMEHGLTPSAISSRLVYSSAPESLQAGVAAGLLAVGSRFVGTTEECAVLLDEIVAAAPDEKAKARNLAAEFRAARKPIPGFGHHLHKPDDPRAIKLVQMSKDLGLAGRHVAAIELLSDAIDQVFQRHITINATGAIAAVLGDMKVPSRLMRGFAVMARTAGLIAHIAEEQEDPSLRFIWNTVDEAMTTR